MVKTNSPSKDAKRTQSRTRAQERRAAGLCGKCSKAAMPGKSRCLDCWQRDKAHKQSAYQRRKTGQVCQTCVNRIINGHSRCAECQRKATDARRIRRQNP